VAAEPVPARELDDLHRRIGDAAAELRARLRRSVSSAPRPDEAMTAATDVLRGLRVPPAVLAGLGAALLTVAGVTAALLARRRP
jgi:hypothetical protein